MIKKRREANRDEVAQNNKRLNQRISNYRGAKRCCTKFVIFYTNPDTLIEISDLLNRKKSKLLYTPDHSSDNDIHYPIPVIPATPIQNVLSRITLNAKHYLTRKKKKRKITTASALLYLRPATTSCPNPISRYKVLNSTQISLSS